MAIRRQTAKSGFPSLIPRPPTREVWFFYATLFVRAAERFLDTTDAAGNIVPGFFPMLNDVFGAGAFGPGGHRLRDFLPSGHRLRDLLSPAPRRPLPTAVAFEETWAVLRARVDGSDVRGALDASAAQAGASTPGKLQHAITSHVERVERGLLHDAITDHGAGRR